MANPSSIGHFINHHSETEEKFAAAGKAFNADKGAGVGCGVRREQVGAASGACYARP